VITLLGTGHVFDLRRRLQREVLARAPDVVCLELDPGRLQALISKQKGGDAPPMYKLLAEFQERIASDRGIAPGDELLAAYEAARDAQVPVELIDMDARVAFQRMWQSMGWMEKGRFLGSAVVGLFLPKRMMDKELERLQTDLGSMMEQLGKEYPTVKRVLIDERNAHMAGRIAALRAGGKERVVAVVGDGHVEGMQLLLAEKGFGAEVEVVRLKDLRTPEAPAEGSHASAGFSTETSWEPPPGGPSG